MRAVSPRYLPLPIFFGIERSSQAPVSPPGRGIITSIARREIIPLSDSVGTAGPWSEPSPGLTRNPRVSACRRHEHPGSRRCYPPSAIAAALMCHRTVEARCRSAEVTRDMLDRTAASGLVADRSVTSTRPAQGASYL